MSAERGRLEERERILRILDSEISRLDRTWASYRGAEAGRQWEVLANLRRIRQKVENES
jgi:muramidase (phage lysozyme)